MQLRILVADDEPYVVEAIRQVLAELPATVLGAGDGEEALRLARAERVDLILLDIKMPKLDGFQVAEALKQDPKTAQVPVMFFSAVGSTKDKVRGLDMGEDYINKPIDPEELKARVRKAVRRLRASVHDSPTSGSLASGSLAAMSLPALIRSFEAERRTARLLLTRAGERGELLFRDGRITHAVLGARQGEAAVYQLMSWTDGTFEMAPAPAGGAAQGPVTVPTSDLLPEGLRRLEEARGLRAKLASLIGPLTVPPAVQQAVKQRTPGDLAALIALLDGSRDLDTILAQSPLDTARTLKALGTLQAMGALTPAAADGERRGGLRFKVSLPIAYQSLGLWQESGTFNLSAWGVFVRTAVPFDAGTDVALRFHLPVRSTPITVMGRVVWSNPDPSKWGGMGMGIQFVDLADDDRDSIEKHLAQMVADQLGGEAQQPAE